MATLYKRATPSQVRVLRIVEGAIRNASHAHPERRITDEMARSIAKRAAGTLTAGWPDVLAARVSRRSGRMVGSGLNPPPQGAQTSKRFGRGASRPAGRRSPLQQIWKLLAYEIGAAQRAGNAERAAILVSVIRVIAALQWQDRFDVENPAPKTR